MDNYMPTFLEITEANVALLALIISLIVGLVGFFYNKHSDRSRLRKVLFEEIYYNYGILNTAIPSENQSEKQNELIIPIARSFISASEQLSFDVYDSVRERIEVLKPNDVSAIIGSYNLMKSLQKVCSELKDLLDIEQRNAEQKSRVVSRLVMINQLGPETHGLFVKIISRTARGRGIISDLEKQRGMRIQRVQALLSSVGKDPSR